MPEKHNIIAMVWDFDKTLSPHFMQKPLFEAYDIDEEVFWQEVKALPDFYSKAGVNVQEDICYLNHMLSYVKAGRLKGLNNARLREFGKDVTFYPGLPQFFSELKAVTTDDQFSSAGITLEHYVVSMGLAEIIRGSAIAKELDGIWASEFIETPAVPGSDLSGPPHGGEISQIGAFFGNTAKTRALFEINKGSNKYKNRGVNDHLPDNKRRVPFSNIVYIADGPSDVPSFSVVRERHGTAYAVYPANSKEGLEKADQLMAERRVDGFGPADFTEKSDTSRWLRRQVHNICKQIKADALDQ